MKLFLYWSVLRFFFLFFFFNDTATTEIYTLSLHDALPISAIWKPPAAPIARAWSSPADSPGPSPTRDRKSTRLNSSHVEISYAVFCLKKKKKKKAGSKMKKRKERERK